MTKIPCSFFDSSIALNRESTAIYSKSHAPGGYLVPGGLGLLLYNCNSELLSES